MLNAIDKQSPDIAQGVDKAYESRTDAADDDELDVAGAGDQGMMFGYATTETDTLMPLPISLAHRLAERLSAVRKDGTLDYLRPDGKTQVSVALPRWTAGRDREDPDLHPARRRDRRRVADQPDLLEHVVEPVLPADLYDETKLRRNFLVNPTGRFVIGGPMGDAASRAARSSSTPTAAWPVTAAARSRARTPPRSTARPPTPRGGSPRTSSPQGLADRAEVQVAYAIGVAHPVSVMVETFGTENDGAHARAIARAVDEVFDLRPGAFREELNLHRPIYQKTAAYGHFGREDPDFTWERTDKAQALRSAAGL